MMDKNVYFIRPIGRAGPVKIGCSYYPLERLRSYTHWSPLPLEIVALCKGNNGYERKLHVMLAASHSHAEWFNASPELERIIERIAAGETIDAVIGATEWPGPKRHGLTTTKLKGRIPHDWQPEGRSRRAAA